MSTREKDALFASLLGARVAYKMVIGRVNVLNRRGDENRRTGSVMVPFQKSEGPTETLNPSSGLPEFL